MCREVSALVSDDSSIVPLTRCLGCCRLRRVYVDYYFHVALREGCGCEKGLDFFWVLFGLAFLAVCRLVIFVLLFLGVFVC